MTMSAVIAMGMSGAAVAELSANADITTNYVWRGLTQSDESLALQGGLDFADKSGVYAGIWASTVKFEYVSVLPVFPFTVTTANDSGIEYDLYAGYKGKSNQLNYDVGIIRYDYTGIDIDSSTEIYGGIGTGPINAVLYMSISPSDLDTNYLTVNFTADVQGIGIKPYIGLWGGDADGTHFGVEASKNINGIDFSATLDINDEDLNDETYVFVMAKKTFQL
jgi:uncharacterized protein (TIGR02001 family)